jgi:hypothetical protein
MKKSNLFAAVFLLLAICLGAQEQNISFSAWGRVVITPAAFSGEHSAASAATNTYADYPQIGFSANGKAPSGNIGFNLDFNFGIDVTQGNKIIIVGDNAKAWVYPFGLLLPERFNMLKLTAGWFKEGELRGRIGGTEFGSWTLPNGGKDEDNIFSRFDFPAGAHFRLEPLKWLDSKWNGLTFQGAFGSNALGNTPGNGLRAILNLYNNEDNDLYGTNYQYYDNPANVGYDGSRTKSAGDVFRAGQYAIGYKIPDIGLARFQFIGNNREVVRWKSYANSSGIPGQEQTALIAGMQARRADVVEFAFLFQPEFTDVLKGFRLDAGVKLPLEYTTNLHFEVYPYVFNGMSHGPLVSDDGNYAIDYTVQLPKTVAVGLSWTPSFFNAFTVAGRIDVSFGGTIECHDPTVGVKVENGAIINCWISPSYRIINNLTAGLDFGLDMHSRDVVFEHNVPVDSRWTDPSEYTDMGLAPWIELGVGGGRVKIGVVVMFPGSPRYKNYKSGAVDLSNPRFKGNPVVSFPVSITYSF